MNEQVPATKKRPLAVDPAILGRSRKVGDAIWIALWAYDRATQQCSCRDGTLVGLVLGGSVVRDEHLARELGRSLKWVRRWRARAVELGLLRAHRFPYGNLLAVVLPGKKFARHEVREAPAWAQSPTPPGVKRTRRPKSRVPTLGLSGVPKGALQSAQNGVSERSKLGTRRKTFTKTVAGGLAQVTFPPSPYVPPQGGTRASSRKTAPMPPLFEFLKEPQNHGLADVREAWESLGMEIPQVQTALHASWENWWLDHRGETVPERAAGFLKRVERYGLQAQAGIKFLAALGHDCTGHRARSGKLGRRLQG